MWPVFSVLTASLQDLAAFCLDVINTVNSFLAVYFCCIGRAPIIPIKIYTVN